MNAQHTEKHVGQGPLVIDLAGAAALGASAIGAKAANLARLADAGFPVPPGLVVTPAAEERWEEASAAPARGRDRPGGGKVRGTLLGDRRGPGRRLLRRPVRDDAGRTPRRAARGGEEGLRLGLRLEGVRLQGGARGGFGGDEPSDGRARAGHGGRRLRGRRLHRQPRDRGPADEASSPPSAASARGSSRARRWATSGW